MKPSAQLLAIQKASGMTQNALAQEIGVSFAALNRWINGNVMPREAAQQRIDALYNRYVERVGTDDKALLAAKKNLIKKLAKQNTSVIKKILGSPDLSQQYELSLTYHTNRLEGSSLTEHETAVVLFENATLPDKTLIEQLEAKNHQTALRAMLRHIEESGQVDEALILRLHGILMNGIRMDAGRYRTHGVRIVGTFVPTANPIKVPLLMAAFGKKVAKKAPVDIVRFVTETHAEFEQVHPFSDGNGRIGRLLANALLLNAGYPPAVITQNLRRDYMSALSNAQLAGNFTPLQHIFADAILEGQNILDRK